MVSLSQMLCFIFTFFLSGALASTGFAHNPILDKGKDKHKDPEKLMNKSSFCIECHQEETPGIFEEWLKSTHARTGVGCADCHATDAKEYDTFLHAEKHYIRTVVSPIICAKCHKDIQRDYFTSGHAQALEVLKTIKEDDPRFPVVSLYKDDNFQQCSGCHGGEVALDDNHLPDEATWPDSGAGRINPNTSHGNCSSCHLGHRFSSAAARQPETCLRCHDGRNYPEGDIYRSSAHGMVYATQTDKENLGKLGFYFTGKDMVAPTCAFCHFNGSGHGQRTRHNGAWRLPRDLTHPEAPMAPKNADKLRSNMKAVCNQCHAKTVINRFFDNADKRLAEYQEKTVQPKLKEYRRKLAEVKEGTERENIIKEYTRFLAEGKRYRMNLYMGNIGRTQR
ncbi:MAG: hypothetical protein KQH63_15380 [Desulfobulbaceae bacterium]|nr:hypothetical protein [Desulfobulbaceae bacterium]